MSTDAIGAAIRAVDALMIRCVPAYVDESGRTSGAGLYVMAAVVVPPGRCDEVRAALRSRLPRGLRRYHWSKEGVDSRMAMTASVRRLRCSAIAVSTAYGDLSKSERARRRCLLRLLWELEQRGVTSVLLESRQSGDRRDQRVILAAQANGWLTHELRYGFARPEDEPLLWLPDVIAGAVTRAVGDRDTVYLDLLAQAVTLITLP